MKPADIRTLVQATWENSIPDRRVVQYKEVRKTVDQADLETFDSMWDVVSNGIQDNPESVGVVLIHGIRTDAKWHQLVKDCLSTEGDVNVFPVGYKFYNVLRFLGPFRGEPVRILIEELEDIREREPKARLVLVAHSFGTYVVSKVLEQRPKIRVDRILFCGAVVDSGYAWHKVAVDLDSRSVVNDVGTKDYLPTLATFATFGYGPSGTLGFQRSRVSDRYFNLGHSGFFTREHVNTYWTPFILRGQIVASPWSVDRPMIPYFVSLAAGSPWIARVLVVLLLLGGSWTLHIGWARWISPALFGQ